MGGPFSPADDRHAVDIVRSGYDDIAEEFAAHVAKQPDARARWTAMVLERLAPGSRVLDIGCGCGVPTAATVVGAGHDLTGIDVSTAQVALARANVPGARFVVGNVLDAGFEPASFDAVTAFYSLTHIPRARLPGVLAGVVRWLAPGGWFLANFGVSDCPGWFEEDFLGFGSTSWTNSFDAATNLRLVDDSGLSIEVSETAEQVEPWGTERWLWVLARSADPRMDEGFPGPAPPRHR